MNIEYSTFSETGRRRENQDYIQVFADKKKDRAAFILCDGMGRHAQGGLAAKIVATSIARDMKQNHPADKSGLHAMISHASRTIDTIAEVYGGVKMGTTMVMAYTLAWHRISSETA